MATIDPGPRVRFSFDGEALSGPLRTSLEGAFRPVGMDARQASDVLRRATVQALRGLGFLDLEVDIEVTADRDAAPAGELAVRVVTRGGRTVQIGPPRIVGLPADDAAFLAGELDSVLSRVELTSAVPSADTFVARTLALMGFPAAGIRDRELSLDGTDPVLTIDPGPGAWGAALDITGVAPDEADRLATLLPVEVGGAARCGPLTRSVIAIEDDLRARGHADVEIQARGRRRDEDDPLALAVELHVVPGPRWRVGEVRFEGLTATDPDRAHRIAGLQAGTILLDEDLASARRRLYRTDPFRRIQVAAGGDVAAAGTAPAEVATDGTTPTEVVFSLTEKPRYTFSCGGRFEDSVGTSAIVDLIDYNFLGRGLLVGGRVNYSTAEQSFRLYRQRPRRGRVEGTLELFLATGASTIDNIDAECLFWVQLSRRLGPRVLSWTYGLVPWRDDRSWND